jgi:SAM-dependent methyltransferase
MRNELLTMLVCPESGAPLRAVNVKESDGEITAGTLTTDDGRFTYPVVRAIPRFVPAENYAAGFGYQWNRFRLTQLDSHTGLDLSRERLLTTIGCKASDLAGKRVLDVGCGAGRFAEVALACGASVVALDYSTAVDACFSNLGPHPRLNVIQGDIYQMPLQPESFDIVYCLGVLQHTPNVKRSFLSLTRHVKPGGVLAVDVYAGVLLNWLWPKYWLRPFLKRLPPERLMVTVETMVKWLLPVSLAVSRIPKVGRRLRYAIPVANHAPDWPLSPEQVREWALLNTFDMFAPRYDQPQGDTTLRSWFEEAGMSDITVFRKGFNIGRGVRKR